MAAEDRLLFDFGDQQAARVWQTVNDGVMGGVSEGEFQITEAGTLRFYGNLSLANNGGFASVRSRSSQLGLQAGDELMLRVRGDGRTYLLNLYVPTRRTAFSYRRSFSTRPNEWVEIRLPLEEFQATSFGQVLRNFRPVSPAEVTSIGFMISDKQAGPFALEVQSVKAVQVSPTP